MRRRWSEPRSIPAWELKDLPGTAPVAPRPGWSRLPSADDLPYDQHRACPKCGTLGVGTRFVADAAPLSVSPSLHYGFKDDDLSERVRLAIAEHVAQPRMVRSCFNCDHEWLELPLDLAAHQALDGRP